MIWIILAVVAVAIVIFLMSKKGETPDELPSADEPKPKLGAGDKPRGADPDKSEKKSEKQRDAEPKARTAAATVKATPAALKEEGARGEPAGSGGSGEPAKAAATGEPAPSKRVDSKPPPAARPKFAEEDFGKPVVFDPVAMRKGLAKTRGGFIARLTDLFRGRKEIDPSVLRDIEEILLTSDVGVKTTQTLLARLHERLERNELGNEDKVWAALREEALAILAGAGQGRMKLRDKPNVVLMVGVNGAGKTTTLGKLASKLHAQGKKVILGAGDTFRAAAVQQLEVWAQREGAEIVKGKEGSDPAAVLFDAVEKAKATGADVVLCDTAGRLQTKANLMEELAKVRRTIAKSLDGAPHDTLLVLDATNGQNALQQARLFMEKIELTGVVLTKLDGTAKGGVVLAIADELKLPVRYIGIGERAADLREFDAGEFVEALFAREAREVESAA